MSDTKTNSSNSTIVEQFVKQPYKYGFSTEIENDRLPNGLDETTIKLLSNKKGEPDFMTEARLNAFNVWKKLKEPDWAEIQHPQINYQDITYYSAPKVKKKLDSLDEVDKE